MRVVIDFDSFDKAEDFVEACMQHGIIVGNSGFDYDFVGYEFTKDGEVNLEVKPREYDEDGFGDFDNDE